MKLGMEFWIDCAHQVKGLEKCEQPHGHTYKIEIVIEGKVGKSGMVLDFADFRKEAERVLGALDHRNLNGLLENPTCENIALHIKKSLKLNVASVRVWEGQHKWAEA